MSIVEFSCCVIRNCNWNIQTVIKSVNCKWNPQIVSGIRILFADSVYRYVGVVAFKIKFFNYYVVHLPDGVANVRSQFLSNISNFNLISCH